MTCEDFAAEQARLKSLLLNKATAVEGLRLCQSHSAQLHSGIAARATLWDDLVAGLTPKAFAFRPQGEFESIAWCTWHTTRIEDAVGNLLIAESAQVFDARWQEAIGVTGTDTANAFSPQDVDTLGATVHMDALLAYRRAVGLRSQQVIAAVEPLRLRKKPSPAAVARLLSEGVLTEHPQSLWLRDFWAGKTIGGLLLLPLTRHYLLHLPNAFRLKQLAQQSM